MEFYKVTFVEGKEIWVAVDPNDVLLYKEDGKITAVEVKKPVNPDEKVYVWADRLWWQS